MNRTLMIALIASAAVVVAVCTVVTAPSADTDTVIKLTAKKFEFSPAEITVKKGKRVVLEIASQDVRHGFNLPDFAIRTDIKPGSANRISFTPDKPGRFAFNCDVFCGGGHEDMSGTLIVTE